MKKRLSYQPNRSLYKLLKKYQETLPGSIRIVYRKANAVQQPGDRQEASIIVYEQSDREQNDIVTTLHSLHANLQKGGLIIGMFPMAVGRKRWKTGYYSKAEILGLLVHAGFTIIEDNAEGNALLLVAKKRGNPGNLQDIIKARRFLFSQPRIGKEGKIIFVFKLRTMYPLSHLVQEYLFQKESFGKMGKITNDFRITPWGKWLRKYWIDELPQIINILQGEMTLVGLRPLSLTFFRQLPKDLQKERIKHLPGLIPPIYADRPKNLEERVRAEKKYLSLKNKYGTKIDFYYLFKIAWAIVFFGERGH